MSAPANPKRRSRLFWRVALGSVVVLASILVFVVLSARDTKPPSANDNTGIHKIKHIIMIMQENRSFDHYFGTFPGADGIEMLPNGQPKACVPNPKLGHCQRPYVDHRDNNAGGPHSARSYVKQINGGKMDGFAKQAEAVYCAHPKLYTCGEDPIDVMGYHVQSDIPNYWKYAQQFVLQDHMFEPTTAWSLPSHLFKVSAWAALCKKHDVKTCKNTGKIPPIKKPIFAWTDLTYLLHKNDVSWRYYVVTGTEPDCRDDDNLSCAPRPQSASTPGIWNPLPFFDTVKDNGQLGNITSVKHFYAAAKNGTLPAVTWIVPSGDVSEHPYAGVALGQSYVTSLINAVMKGPNWDSSAIFVAWDDWGGFYDHVPPPKVDVNGYGIRVPGFMVSPYAKRGFIDHQTLSFDAYLKFIEDDFLEGQRLDPKTDGRPDGRPTVRENLTILGDLRKEFDFNQPPRPPMILPVEPRTTLTATIPFHPISPVAKPGIERATLHWQPPPKFGGDGGSPITGYEIRPFRKTVFGRVVAEKPRRFQSKVPKQVVTGLRGGSSYTFKIVAVNAVGAGYESAPTKAVTILPR